MYLWLVKAFDSRFFLNSVQTFFLTLGQARPHQKNFYFIQIKFASVCSLQTFFYERSAIRLFAVKRIYAPSSTAQLTRMDRVFKIVKGSPDKNVIWILFSKHWLCVHQSYRFEDFTSWHPNEELNFKHFFLSPKISFGPR